MYHHLWLLVLLTAVGVRCIFVSGSLILPCNQEKECIQRFFDTSPLSFDQKYVAYVQFSRDKTLPADIILYDLNKSSLSVVETTFAWGSQLGAQVQWSSNSHHIYFNRMKSSNTAAFGVRYNIMSKESKGLECPIYHISSDGKYAVSPNLYKMKYMQKGYGIDVWKSHYKYLDHFHDGIFLSDISTGRCKLLYSIHNVTSAIGIRPQKHSHIFGFHTKFSSDGKYILFVMRSYEQTFTVGRRNKDMKHRVNHLVVLSVHEYKVQYLFSWSSKAFIHNKMKLKLRDGNHPNWIPNSHRISMNFNASYLPSSNSRVFPSTSFDKKSKWSTVVIDLNTLPCQPFSLFHQSFILTPYFASGTKSTSQPPCNNKTLPVLPLHLAWTHGYGHPSFHANGRHIVTDVYEKEVSSYAKSNPSNTNSEGTPILLHDTSSHRTATLRALPVSKSTLQSSSLLNQVKQVVLGGKEDRSMRWDVHVCWSADYHHISYNTIDERQMRRVAIMPVDLSARGHIH